MIVVSVVTNSYSKVNTYLVEIFTKSTHLIAKLISDCYIDPISFARILIGWSSYVTLQQCYHPCKRRATLLRRCLWHLYVCSFKEYAVMRRRLWSGTHMHTSYLTIRLRLHLNKVEIVNKQLIATDTHCWSDFWRRNKGTRQGRILLSASSLMVIGRWQAHLRLDDKVSERRKARLHSNLALRSSAEYGAASCVR